MEYYFLFHWVSPYSSICLRAPDPLCGCHGTGLDDVFLNKSQTAGLLVTEFSQTLAKYLFRMRALWFVFSFRCTLLRPLVTMSASTRGSCSLHRWRLDRGVMTDIYAVKRLSSMRVKSFGNNFNQINGKYFFKKKKNTIILLAMWDYFLVAHLMYLS